MNREKEESDLLLEAQYCFALAKRVIRCIKADGLNPQEAVAVKEALIGSR